MYENVVIRNPLVDPFQMFAYDADDWDSNEYRKTLFTHERYLPKILVDCGVVKSV